MPSVSARTMRSRRTMAIVVVPRSNGGKYSARAAAVRKGVIGLQSDGVKMARSTMVNGDVVAWQLLLERADGARRRTGEESLRFHDRLAVRCYADSRRHV